MPMIEDSSAIDGIFFREPSNLLYVFMRDGSAIIYEDVPRKIYKDFVDADSKGRYFNKVIRTHFPYRYV